MESSLNRNEKILREIESIELKVSYLYNKVKEFEDFINAMQPTLEEFLRNASDTVLKLSEDERLLKIKNLLLSLDGIVKILDDIRYNFRTILEEASPVFMTLMLKWDFDKVLKLIETFEIDLDMVLNNFKETSRNISKLLEDKHTYILLSNIATNIKTINETTEILLKYLDEIQKLLPNTLNISYKLFETIERYDYEKIFEEIHKTEITTDDIVKYIHLINVSNRAFKNLSSKDLEILGQIIAELLDKDSFIYIRKCIKEIKPILKNLPDLLKIVNDLIKPETIEHVKKISEHLKDVLEILSDERLLNIIKSILISIYETTPKKYGRLGMISALGDENIQYSLGYGIEVLKNLGKNLKAIGKQ